MEALDRHVFKKIPLVQAPKSLPTWNLPPVTLCKSNSADQAASCCSTFEISRTLCVAPEDAELFECAHPDCRRLVHRSCQSSAHQNPFHPFCLECTILYGRIDSRFVSLCLPFREFLDGVSVEFEVGADLLGVIGKHQNPDLVPSSPQAQLAFRYGLVGRQASPHEKAGSAAFRIMLDGSMVGLIQPTPHRDGLVVGTVRLGLLAAGKHTLSVHKVSPKVANPAKKGAATPSTLVFGALGLLSFVSSEELICSVVPGRITTDTAKGGPLLVKGIACHRPDCVFDLEERLLHASRKHQQENEIWWCKACGSPIIELVNWDPQNVRLCDKKQAAHSNRKHPVSVNRILATQTGEEEMVPQGYRAYLGKRNGLKELNVESARAVSPKEVTNIKSHKTPRNWGLPELAGIKEQEGHLVGGIEGIQPTFEDMNDVLDKAGGRSTLGELARGLSQRIEESGVSKHWAAGKSGLFATMHSEDKH